MQFRITLKPSIEVCFEDGSTKARYKAGQEITVPIYIKNVKKRYGFLTPEARRVSVCVNAQTIVPLKKLEYLDLYDDHPKKAPKGPFEGMHFLVIHDAHTIFYWEEMPVILYMKMPEESTSYTLKVDISSTQQGSLGIHHLVIIAEK